jgi:hypothetical protein
MEEASDDELFASFRKMLDTAEEAGLVGVRSEKKRRGESEESPGHPPGTPSIVLQFVPPAVPLPSGSEAKTNDPASQVVDAEATEVADVFDE